MSIIVFAMMRLMPGDVATRMVEGHAYAPTLADRAGARVRGDARRPDHAHHALLSAGRATPGVHPDCLVQGLSERTIVLRHALKNAMIPAISLIGLQMPLYIGGSVIIEAIFWLPGIRLFFFEAQNKLDYPVVQSVNLIIATMVVGLNLLIDLSYAFLDPRVVRRRVETRCSERNRSARSAASSWWSCWRPRCSPMSSRPTASRRPACASGSSR